MADKDNNVIGIFSKELEEDIEQEQNEKLESFTEIIERNKKNRQRIERERQQKNEQVKRKYRLNNKK